MKVLRAVLVIMLMTSTIYIAQDKLNRDLCRQLALSYNQDVKSAKLQTKSIESTKDASGKDYYPRLGFIANYEYIGNPLIIYDAFATLNNRYNLNATIMQDLYAGGRISSQYALNESYEKLARENENLTSANLVMETDVVYWQTVADKENEVLANLYLETISNLFEVIKNRVEAELISKNDLLITEVRLNDAKLSVLESENRLIVSKMELNRLIGYEITKLIIVAKEIDVELYEYDFENLVERALQQRPELLMQLQNIEANKHNEDLTASQYLPQWSLGANALWGVPSPDLTNDPAFNYSVFSTFSVPLFLWNKSSLDVQAQTLLTDSQREQLEMLNEIVTLEVQSTKYSYDESIKRVELTSRSLKRAEENLDIMTTRYKEGLSPILEVLDAQVFWNKANVDYIEAKRLYQVSYSALLKSIGELY